MLHLFSEIPLLLFSLPPTSPNQFGGVTWPLLPSSPIYLLLIVVIFYSPMFSLSCLPICTSSVRTPSVNFLFVTPPPVCAKNLSVALIVAYSSHIFCSPQILDGGKTAMRKPPQQRWRDCDVGASAISFDLVTHLLNDDNGGASAISLNSWQRQDCNGKTAHRPPQQLWRDCDIGTSAIFFNLAVRHPWQWQWQCVRNLLKFLTAVTLQSQRIGNLLDNDGMWRIGELLDSTSFVGR